MQTAQVTPPVRCLEVTKFYAGVEALGGVSVDLHAGECVCLVGDNGAGKSTLVKILSGIMAPDSGEVQVDGKPVTLSRQAARQHGIEAVYQDLALCDTLGAVANVMLGQEPIRFKLGPLRFIDWKAAAKTATRKITEIGIELDDPTTPVRRLSGGQRQAIAIARATVRGHRMVIFDEPTAALGVRQTKTTLELVRRVADQGVAVVMISHNLDEVFAVADRIVALRLGRVTLDARLDDTSREEVVACMTGAAISPEARP
jgi:ABC-type sugar transport system ATPase subunit